MSMNEAAVREKMNEQRQEIKDYRREIATLEAALGTKKSEAARLKDIIEDIMTPEACAIASHILQAGLSLHNIRDEEMNSEISCFSKALAKIIGDACVTEMVKQYEL